MIDDATRAFAEELRKWWSFDEGQQHTHSWHDREDFIEKKLGKMLRALAALAAPAASRAPQGVEGLAAEIEGLRRKEHAYCEDGYYGCPQNPESFGHEGAPCDCGFDAHNAKVDAIAARLRALRPQPAAAREEADRLAAHVRSLSRKAHTEEARLALDDVADDIAALPGCATTCETCVALEKMLAADADRAEFGVITLVNDRGRGYAVEDQNGGTRGRGKTLTEAAQAAAARGGG